MINRYFYKDTLCLNVLAKDIHNAKAIYETMEGHVLIGVLSANYHTVEAACEDIVAYKEAIDGAVSLGLGNGNPEQWKMVAEIGRDMTVPHMNQIFPAVGYSRAICQSGKTFINSLVGPTDQVGYVNVATGPLSSNSPAANVPIEPAIALIREMGGAASMFFPLVGLHSEAAYRKIEEGCAAEGMAIEPTGGIDVHNFEKIVTIALEVGVKQIIPHVYSSIIDKATGETQLRDVEQLYDIMRKVGA